MRTITIKNIPDDLYERLKERAKANRRSINSEIIVCIEQSMQSQRFDPDELLAKARILREKTSSYKISEEEIHQAKNSGRL